MKLPAQSSLISPVSQPKKADRRALPPAAARTVIAIHDCLGTTARSRGSASPCVLGTVPLDDLCRSCADTKPTADIPERNRTLNSWKETASHLDRDAAIIIAPNLVARA